MEVLLSLCQTQINNYAICINILTRKMKCGPIFTTNLKKKPRSFLTQNRLIFTTMNDNPWKYQPSKKKRCSALRYKYFTIIKKCQTLLFKFESPDTELSNMNYIFKKNLVIMFTFWKLSKRRTHIYMVEVYRISLRSLLAWLVSF